MADTLLDLAEAGKTTAPLRQTALQQLIVEENPLMEFIEWKQLPAGKNGLSWFQESVLPTANFRAVNGSWDADHGIIVPKQEHLAILGGEVEIDQFILDTMGGEMTPGEKDRQYSMKIRAAQQKWEETLLEGDRGIDPNAFDGLRVRASESAMDFDMSGGTDVAALTLAKLDELDDAVVGRPTVRMMNQWLSRKIEALVRSASQAREVVTTEFGSRLNAYANIPNVVIQKEHDMTSILDFDEDPGDGGDDAASIYFPRLGDTESMRNIFGILGNGGAWAVRDFGEQQAVPRGLGRISVYVGLVTPHPRCFARLNSVGQI